MRQPAAKANWSIFGIHVDFLKGVRGGSLLIKKPLERVLSVYTNSENAISKGPQSGSIADCGESVALKAQGSSRVSMGRRPARVDETVAQIGPDNKGLARVFDRSVCV